MDDAKKTKAELIAELDTLRRRIAALERDRAQWESTRPARLAFPSARLPETAFAGLLKLMRTLATPREVEVFLDEAVRTAVDSVPAADSGSIQLLESDGEILRTVAGTGMGKAKRGTTPFQPGVGVAGHALQSGRVVNVPDVLDDPRFVPGILPLRFRALMVAPLAVERRAVGTLSLSSAQVNAFTPEDEAVVEVIADAVAFALEYVRLIASLRASEEALRRFNAELEQRVTERTADLERERERLDVILGSMGEGVIYTDPAGDIEYVNQAITTLTGYSAEALIGQPWLTLYASPLDSDEFTKTSQAMLRTIMRGLTWRGEVRLRRKDGAAFDAGLSVSRIHLPLGAGWFITVVRDISQEKALQAQKDRFIAHASHELRTPLSNIIARLYLIRRQPDKTDAHLAIIETAAHWMSELVEDLLDLSRFERGAISIRRTAVELRRLIDEVVVAQQPQATLKRITLTTAAPDDPARILADPNRIIQVITNLVVNAINYTPEGGEVHISLAIDADGYAVLRVCDTGPGLPREVLSRLFEPFFRATEGAVKGSGLGLTISKEIVAAHGGDIRVESVEGVGSAFTVRLPLLGAAGVDQDESTPSTAR